MHKTLHQLKKIAAAIGYQILQADNSPGDFFLVRQLGEDSLLVTQVDIEVPRNTKCSLEDLGEALGLAIDHLISVLMTDLTKRCHTAGPIPGDLQLLQIADAAGVQHHAKSPHNLSRQDIVELADHLHQFALNLYHRHT